MDQLRREELKTQVLEKRAQLEELNVLEQMRGYIAEVSKCFEAHASDAYPILGLDATGDITLRYKGRLAIPLVDENARRRLQALFLAEMSATVRDLAVRINKMLVNAENQYDALLQKIVLGTVELDTDGRKERGIKLRDKEDAVGTA